jgi:hypothetical protein
MLVYSHGAGAGVAIADLSMDLQIFIFPQFMSAILFSFAFQTVQLMILYF